MTDLEFKQFIFSEQCELTPYSLLLLLYIKMQNRDKYVFYNADMMSALKIRDIRCLRRAKDELLNRGLIRQKPAGRGFKFIICKLDEPSTSNVSDTKNAPSTLNVSSAFNADNLVRLTQQPSTFDAEKQYVKRTTKINNKETIKENENEKTEEHVKTEPECKTEKYKEYQDISEFDKDTQDALAFLRTRFS